MKTLYWKCLILLLLCEIILVKEDLIQIPDIKFEHEIVETSPKHVKTIDSDQNTLIVFDSSTYSLKFKDNDKRWTNFWL
jgi:hypothetical protein